MARKRTRGRAGGFKSRKSRRRGGPNPLLLLGAAAAVAGIGALFYLQSRTATAMSIDPATLCPPGGPAGMTAILIDVTDALAPSQAAKLLEFVEEEVRQAPIATQFTLGVVSDDPQRLGSTDALCKPWAGNDVSSLTQNVAAVQERYQEKFHDPLRRSFQDMIAASDATRSPIMEGLQSLVAETPRFVTFDGPKEIIIVSDLLQHSDAMSFYRGEDWQGFMASPASQRLSDSLHGVDVSVYLIPRPAEGVDDPAVIEDFWVRYFDVQGANLPRIRRLGDL
ncbi:hypothetical protein KTN05_12160 [Paracoccus sp. Z118]|uniref:hypothetical protein n=1 Tax=Paracoccus sp. Z118 TaxID=2851017 RepID=UPI001C2CA3CD|nr:hypothetical protein [Paracoccus sp. Z118]MBV0892604.1 hypothetical protein [Paracoccus sp. Z118]